MLPAWTWSSASPTSARVGASRSSTRVHGPSGRYPGVRLLDRTSDPDHDRSVLTFAGAPDRVLDGMRALATEAIARIDLRHQHGRHPRIGALDVAPFVPHRRHDAWAPASGSRRRSVDGWPTATGCQCSCTHVPRGEPTASSSRTSGGPRSRVSLRRSRDRTARPSWDPPGRIPRRARPSPVPARSWSPGTSSWRQPRRGAGPGHRAAHPGA